jgi:hypothetical protein
MTRRFVMGLMKIISQAVRSDKENQEAGSRRQQAVS